MNQPQRIDTSLGPDARPTDLLAEVYQLVAQGPRVLVLGLEAGVQLASEIIRSLRIAQAQAALDGVLVVIRSESPDAREHLRSHGLIGVYG